MPVMTLEFSIPDEQHEADCAYRGALLFSAAMAFSNDLRAREKWEELSDEARRELELIRDTFYGHFGELL